MKKPYIKKILEVAGFKVWLVNGYWIRKNLCDDFTNYSQHYQFKFIPKDEFWIDREASKRKEIKYYIQALLMMNSLMEAGVSRKKAAKIADEVEKAERAKSKVVKKLEEERQDKERVIKKIHKKFLKKLSNDKLKVWIIRGDIVRAMFYTDFTQGGHEFVYKFIPKGEVWIDDDLYKKEVPYVLIHELHERRLMSLGMRYDPAHDDANAIEFYCRHHPNVIKKRIKSELKMNK